MNTKSSAHYQREYRKRLRQQGLVKKEVWIRPEHSEQLAAVEKSLRSADPDSQVPGGTTMSENTSAWTTMSLYEALKSEEPFTGGNASIRLIDGIEPSLELEMHEYGDLPVFITVYGEQIIAEAVLWPQEDVKDPAEFNDTVLRTHKYFPLSTISLDSLREGGAYYQMFGALSATSRLHSVLYEIETLARNVIQATEAYSGFLSVEVSA